MHFYKLQMNSEGSGQPDWQTIGELEMKTPIINASEAQFWVTEAVTDNNQKLINQLDGQWVKFGNEYHRTYIGKNCITLQFKLVKE